MASKELSAALSIHGGNGHPPNGDAYSEEGILYPDLPEISREEIRRRLHDPAFAIVDVHAAEVYAAEHLPRALNLPLPDIESHAPQVLANRHTDIAVYCTKFT